MIETEIANLTKAVQDLAAAIRSSVPALPAAAEPTEKKTRTKKSDTPAAPAAETKTETPAPAPEPAKTEAPGTPTHADVRTLQSQLMDRGLIEECKAVNAHFNVKRASDIPADKLAEALAMCQAIADKHPDTGTQAPAPAPETKKEEPAKAPVAQTEVLPSNDEMFDACMKMGTQMKTDGHVKHVFDAVLPHGFPKISAVPKDKIAPVYTALKKTFDSLYNEAV